MRWGMTEERTRKRERRPAVWGALALACLGAGEAVAGPATQPVKPVLPLVHAHAHNDYEHARPLAEALECGFCSVEADVHLINGKLRVAHDLKHAVLARTLEELYLDPLRARVRANGGWVYPGGPEVTLLVDIKSDPVKTYAAVREVLAGYADMLAVWREGKKTAGAVEVVVTGGVPRGVIAKEAVRYVACDGLIADAFGDVPAALVPQVNGHWRELFTWTGRGEMPSGDRALLGEIVEHAHARGMKVRFWDAPDDVAAWRALREAGVDLINTDDLEGAREFLRGELSH
jgi:hypothetical protein